MFDVETKRAYSYDWWCFVKPIKGELVFNAYRYSNSTCKHQWKVRQLLSELGVKVDRYVEVHGRGLNEITTLTQLKKAVKETAARMLEIEQGKRERRNRLARERRAAARVEARRASMGVVLP